MAPEPFPGGCALLCAVHVADLVEWVVGISHDTWPDWNKGAYRPAVVTDPLWEGMKEKTDRLVSELLELFPGCSDTYRAISIVHPGDYVPPHTDTLCAGWISRVHVPLVTNLGAAFISEGEDWHMEVGKAYQVNPSLPHAIRNAGGATRIHLMFDVVR